MHLDEDSATRIQLLKWCHSYSHPVGWVAGCEYVFGTDDATIIYYLTSNYLLLLGAMLLDSF